MNKKRIILKATLTCIAGSIIMMTNTCKANAYEEAIAGISTSLESAYHIDNENNNIEIESLNIIPGMNDIAIANVTVHLNIRKEPGTDKELVGKLTKNGGLTVLKADDGSGWTKIKSGKVTGYVSTEFIITGEEAKTLAQKHAKLVATSNANGLYVRENPSVDSSILTQIAIGEELYVEEELVVEYGSEYSKWVKVSIDNNEKGYVAKEFVNLSYELEKASPIETIIYGTAVSSTRVNLVNKAKTYLGGRYVWGGTRLGSGVDCSGFTQALFRVYGKSIPRTSQAQSNGGRSITSSNLKPGDLVFYGSSKRSVNHVALYIGNGQVIHASSPRSGIKISNMRYRTPVNYARYLD
ncbi:MAG TPA: C40 family peptidase [Clostridiales bacterium]|nr:C40 family peptidase [Clostridiales bacterium]